MSKCTKKTAIAIGCHPDDIEFMMAGTLIKLNRIPCVKLTHIYNGRNSACYHV